MLPSKGPISFALIAAIGAVIVLPAGARAQKTNADRPPISEIESEIHSAFKRSSTFRPGDLITRSQVSAALDKVKQIGWEVPKQNELLERVLPDNDFLVTQLKTPKGKRLYSQVANTPGAIDMLDRIRQMPNGRKTFEVWVQKTRGTERIIKDMATTKRGQRFAKDIAKFKGSQDFTKPTKKIYRVSELIAEVRTAYKEEEVPKTP